MKRVLTITLNPAIDITTGTPRVLPGRKLRCEAPMVHPGGGGVNVSRMIKELGGETTALVAIGGATGTHMRELLAKANIPAVFVEARGSTRQSLAVHDRTTGEHYRFLLPGPVQDSLFAEHVLTEVADLLAANGWNLVVASGSLPPGVADDFYGRLADVVRAAGARLILDSSGPPVKAALRHGVFLVRTNRIEAGELAEAMGIDSDDPEKLARKIFEDGSAEVVITALGPDGALIFHDGHKAHLRASTVKVVSPVGAGDSFVGAMCFGLAEGWPLERACAYGVAAAAAAVSTEATELAYKADVDRLFAETVSAD